MAPLFPVTLVERRGISRSSSSNSSAGSGSRAGSFSSPSSNTPKTSSPSSGFKWNKPSTWGLPSGNSAPKPKPIYPTTPKSAGSPPNNPLSKSGSLPVGLPVGDYTHRHHHHHQDKDHSKSVGTDHHGLTCDGRCRKGVGGAFGGIAAVILLALLIFCCLRRRRGSKDKSRQVQGGRDHQEPISESRGLGFEMLEKTEKTANSTSDGKQNGVANGVLKPPSYEASKRVSRAPTVGQVSKVTPFLPEECEFEAETGSSSGTSHKSRNSERISRSEDKKALSLSSKKSSSPTVLHAPEAEDGDVASSSFSSSSSSSEATAIRHEDEQSEKCPSVYEVPEQGDSGVDGTEDKSNENEQAQAQAQED